MSPRKPVSHGQPSAKQTTPILSLPHPLHFEAAQRWHREVDDDGEEQHEGSLALEAAHV